MNKIFDKNKTGYYVSSNVYSNTQSTPRKVETYELELYTTSTNISVINDVQYSQKNGNVLIAKPGDVRFSINPFECYYTHFKCTDAEISSALNALPSVFVPDNADTVSEVFKSLISVKNPKNISETLYIQGKLAELISLCIFENSEKYDGCYKQYIPEIEFICDYMRKNFECDITLSDIAAAVNLSPGFFHKIFKSVKGITPLRYLTNIRLENAKKLLRESCDSLSEIAFCCGFNSQSYFNYVFKEETNITPKNYRDKNRIII